MEDDFSILDKEKAYPVKGVIPAFYLDLNLDQIIDSIVIGWSPHVKKYYSWFPLNESCEAYRRAVYHDIRNDTCYEALSRFLETVKKMNASTRREEATDNQMQKNVWHLRVIRDYCEAFENLLSDLRKENLTSEGMKEFRERLERYLSTAPYQEMSGEVSALMRELAELRLVITYDRDLINVSEGKAAGDYEAFMERDGDRNRPALRSPFLTDPNMNALEYECLKILARKRPALFSSLKNAAKKYQEFGEELCFRFIREIQYYLSYRAFQLEMERKGFRFCTPETDPQREMKAEGLYDLALAIAATREGREVISNPMLYREGERFFVLTGPNQGGKTTYARSLGQLIFFTKMGLNVPAAYANVHYFRNILTHFSVEESLETGRGKLKEELLRLAPMMESREENAFVVINELFTTASNNDAEIMGKKVLHHFIGQGCMGIYVTHLKELSESYPEVVSLRAMLNGEGIQTFRIERRKAEDQAYAVNLVNKYRLAYGQIKERI